MKTARVYLFRGIAFIGALLLIAFTFALSNAKVELTEHGAHKRLLVPIGIGNARFNTFAGTGDDVRMPGFLDGPVVRRKAGGGWAASWYCEDKGQHRSGSGAELTIDCAGTRHQFPVARAPLVPDAVFDTPEDTLILSDIEGNVRYLDAVLKALDVTDAEGKWSYGQNHLVINGDAVDRGRDVFAVLWRLYSLSLQAQDAGGSVHLVLGNHEQYLLRGNVSRANRDHLYALTRMGGNLDAFGPDTLIGRWLRLQPVIIKSGRTVITHGGVNPILADAGFTISKLNSAMRRYWSGDMPAKAGLDAVIGPAGLTQYRGYLEDGEDRFARATGAQIGEVLAHFGAKTIVVGHTLVERVTALHEGKVWAVDVNSDSARPEALLIRDGEAEVVSTGVVRQLDEGKERRLIRPFSLFAPADLAMLKALVLSNYALSQIPQPY
jgi:hypothetical protein